MKEGIMDMAEQILRLIQSRLAPIEAKLALMVARTDLLEKRISELEKHIDEIEADDDVDEVAEMGAEIEHDSLLNHLIEDNLHTMSESANHISLTVDLSKKRS